MPRKTRTKSTKPKTPKPEKRRWRENNITLWRKARTSMTQQDVADWLTERGLKLDRVSVLRIEGGKQMPSIEVLEAMASLYRTDVTSMCDVTPEDAEEIEKITALPPAERRRLIRLMEAARDETE